jgi:flavin-dependent dehydrogenase
MNRRDECDVIVFGGGLAGMTAALQLKRTRPKTRIVVVEKREHPVPEAAFKVGESVAEVGAYYLKSVVGIQDHLESEHLRKMSLRVFSTSNGNTDISRRPEIGVHRLTPLRTYQIDRGRLENYLASELDNNGIELLDGHSVSSFELGDDRHEVVVRNGSNREFSAKWIVDASGRTGLLRRQLRLGTEIPHDVNAAWFRVPEWVQVDNWSDDPAWRAKVPSGKRWTSTNHLVGEGYWIWLIPLASGAMSIGLVADPRFVPYETIRRYPDLMDWMREHEPELASKLPDSESGLLDFRKLKKYAYGTRRGLSPQRWCLTGEAGLFLDPLYSTGVDFIAVANTLATRLITGALDGEGEERRRLKAYNSYYLGQFIAWAPAFAGQYEVFRDAQATTMKLIWDNASYFHFPAMLFLKGVITDHEFMAQVAGPLRRAYEMTIYMQRCVRELCRDDCDLRSAGFPVPTDQSMEEIFGIVNDDIPKAKVLERVPLHLARLQTLATELTETYYGACGRRPPEPDYEQPEPETGTELLQWLPYSQRSEPPAMAAPQPEGAWMLR